MTIGLVKLASKCFGKRIFVIVFYLLCLALSLAPDWSFSIIKTVSSVRILAENRVRPMEFFCRTGRQIERTF
jgi:hypothetical protein